MIHSYAYAPDSAGYQHLDNTYPYELQATAQREYCPDKIPAIGSIDPRHYTWLPLDSIAFEDGIIMPGWMDEAIRNSINYPTLRDFYEQRCRFEIGRPHPNALGWYQCQVPPGSLAHPYTYHDLGGGKIHIFFNDQGAPFFGLEPHKCLIRGIFANPTYLQGIINGTRHCRGWR